MSENTAPDAEAAPEPTVAESAALEISDVFGDIAEFWGFTRTQGRIFGILFMSERPLAHTEIRDTLGISAGSASMTLASLVDWGVVDLQGRRYRAVTDLWKVITGVLRRRERARVLSTIERVQGLADRLSAAPGTSATRFALRRVEHLLKFFRLGRTFLDAFVAQSPVHRVLTSIARRAAALPMPTNSSRKQDVRLGA